MSQPLDPSQPPNQGLVNIIRGVVTEMLTNPSELPLEFRNWLPQYVDLNMLQHGPRHRNDGPDPIPFPANSISAVSATSAFMLPFATYSDQVTLSTTPSASSASLFWQRQPVPLAASAGDFWFDTNGAFSATSDPVFGKPCLRINEGGLYMIYHKMDWSHDFGTSYGYNRVSFNGEVIGSLQWRPVNGNTLGQAAWWPPTASATAGAATGDGFDVGGFKYQFGDHATGETSTELLSVANAPFYKTIGYLHDKGSDATVDFQYTVVRLSDDPSV